MIYNIFIIWNRGSLYEILEPLMCKSNPQIISGDCLQYCTCSSSRWYMGPSPPDSHCHCKCSVVEHHVPPVIAQVAWHRRTKRKAEKDTWMQAEGGDRFGRAGRCVDCTHALPPQVAAPTKSPSSFLSLPPTLSHPPASPRLCSPHAEWRRD